MKKLALILALVLSTTALMASEREFRVNRGSVNEAGYAIAWGVPGKLVDFEALDKKTDAEIYDFVTTNTIVNYVVDLETNKILAKLDVEETDYSINGQRYGNQFHLELKTLKTKNLILEDVIVVISNYKWANQMTDLFVIDRENDVAVVLNLKDSKIDQLVKAALRKGLTKTQEIRMFEEGAQYINDIRYEYIDDVGYVVKLTMQAEIPKSEETTDGLLEIDATLSVVIENGQVLVKTVFMTSKYTLPN